jgi:hypothetical protein
MTETDDLPLAVYDKRVPGKLVLAEIEGGVSAAEDRPALAPLFFRFRVPGPEDSAIIEARSREAMLNLIQGRGAEARYGLTGNAAMDEGAIAALTPFITAIESAALLVVDWNYAIRDPDGAVAKVAITPETIAELFRGRPLARSGWNLQYETVTPMERSEGNVSAASPDTTSATAANTAEGASRAEADAAAAVSAAPAVPVPEP